MTKEECGDFAVNTNRMIIETMAVSKSIECLENQGETKVDILS